MGNAMKKILFFMLISTFAETALAADMQYNFRVDGITCPTCIIKVNKVLEEIDGVKSVGFDTNQGIVKTCVKDSVVFTDTQVNALFLERGFNYQGMKKQKQCDPA
jgi:copper chaperone CopZ